MKSQKSNIIAFFIQCLLLLATAIPAFSEELAGHKFLVTSVRTGKTEIFLVDPELGDAVNLTRSPNSEERYHAGHPMESRSRLHQIAMAPIIYTSCWNHLKKERNNKISDQRVKNILIKKLKKTYPITFF